jgi:hemolysin activation/secretion protein
MGDQTCTPRPKPAKETASLMVVSIAVQGVTVFPRSVYDMDIAPLAGRKVSPGALARAADALVCRYRARGYVFADAQVLQGQAGAWRVVVTEGVLSRLEAAVDDPNIARMVRRAFAGLKVGKPINANAVRRGLVLAADLGVSDVRPTVRRSRSDPGALDVVLVVKPPVMVVGLDVENFNSQTLGRWGALASLALNGLTPLYDRTSIGVFQSLQGAGQSIVQASSHVLAPLIQSGIGVDLAYSLDRPGGALAPLDIQSSSWFARLSIDRFVLVRRGLVMQTSAGLEAIDQSTDFLGGEPFVRDRLRILFVRARCEALGFGGVFDGSVEARKGLWALGALTSDAPLLSVPGADPQAFVLRANLSYTRGLGPLNVTGALRGQYTDRTLASFEQMTFGSLNGGPGFDPAAVAGDRGLAGNLEIDGPAYQSPWRLSLRPYVFSDAALIETVAPSAQNGQWAASAGAGLRLDLADRASFNLSYAAPFRSGGAAEGAFGPRILFELTAMANNPLGQIAHFLFRGGARS